jgi:hypothetical protein
MVLRGMTGRLAELDMLVVEASSIPTLKGGPDLHDVIHFMRGQGFVIFDVIGMARRPLDGAMAQLDLLFVPEGSPLRADRRWSA